MSGEKRLLKREKSEHGDDRNQHIGCGIEEGAQAGAEVKYPGNQPVQDVAQQACKQQPLKQFPPARNRGVYKNRGREQPEKGDRVRGVSPDETGVR